ncbi:hypothetical protein LB505_009241 [Fusarium chuoi]|nr:hypothetical protein LB505_009241 [Fusarium chuoi]
MTSYNLINGVHADLNKHTLKDILRGEWGYEGTVKQDVTSSSPTPQNGAWISSSQPSMRVVFRLRILTKQLRTYSRW